MHLPWRDVAPGPGPVISTSITEAETTKLREFAADAVVLEIGAAYGYSAVVMGLAGAQVTSVDPHDWLNSYTSCMANLGVYGVKAEVHRASSWQMLPRFAEQGRMFDLVLIDGDHAEQTVAHDLQWASKLLTRGGIVAVHDYLETCCCPGVQAALDAALGPAGPHEMVDTLRLVRP